MRREAKEGACPDEEEEGIEEAEGEVVADKDGTPRVFFTSSGSGAVGGIEAAMAMFAVKGGAGSSIGVDSGSTTMCKSAPSLLTPSTLVAAGLSALSTLTRSCTDDAGDVDTTTRTGSSAATMDVISSSACSGCCSLCSCFGLLRSSDDDTDDDGGGDAAAEGLADDPAPISAGPAPDSALWIYAACFADHEGNVNSLNFARRSLHFDLNVDWNCRSRPEKSQSGLLWYMIEEATWEMIKGVSKNNNEK